MSLKQDRIQTHPLSLYQGVDFFKLFLKLGLIEVFIWLSPAWDARRAYLTYLLLVYVYFISLYIYIYFKCVLFCFFLIAERHFFSSMCKPVYHVSVYLAPGSDSLWFRDIASQLCFQRRCTFHQLHGRVQERWAGLEAHWVVFWSCLFICWCLNLHCSAGPCATWMICPNGIF